MNICTSTNFNFAKHIYYGTQCDRQHPCATCQTRSVSCTYELVEAAAAAAAQPPSLRCLPPAPRYVFAPDNSLKYMPASSFPLSGTSKLRRSVNTAFQDSPFALQCTSDSAAAAKLSSGGDLPPLAPLPSMRNSNTHSSSSLYSGLGSSTLPPLRSSYNSSSLNPTLQPNVRSGSWSQVENALPPLNMSMSDYQPSYPSLSRRPSHSGLSSFGGEEATSSSDHLDLPPLPTFSRSG